MPGAPDPTRLTDWHMVMLPRLLPTLSHVSLHDAEPDGGWLHRRALAHLGRCRWVDPAAVYGFPLFSQCGCTCHLGIRDLCADVRL